MRWLLLSFVLWLASSTASAQSVAWVGSDATELAPPTARAPTHHVLGEKMLAGGLVMLPVGYVGAVLWAAYYVSSVPLGVLHCNDLYAGWHFVPIIGPVIGMLAGGGCIPDGLHVEEAVLPVLFSALQLAGTILTIFGALGRDVPDAPRISLSFDASGVRATLRGSF